jgi:hypothetical protein
VHHGGRNTDYKPYDSLDDGEDLVCIAPITIVINLQTTILEEDKWTMMKEVLINNGSATITLRTNSCEAQIHHSQVVGEDDPEVYLPWALEVDKIFHLHNNIQHK